MKILDLSVGKKSWDIEIHASLLFESALGLAAVTYAGIRDTLERTTAEWDEIIARLSPEAQRELEYCAEHNTWQALLRLLHTRACTEIGEFVDHLRAMTVEEFRYQVMPPLGGLHEDELRRRAAAGEAKALNALIEAAAGHGFLAAYVPFFLKEDGEKLKAHLVRLLQSWHEAAVTPRQEHWESILQREIKAKREMQGRLSAEAFLEWALGKPYVPEPGVSRILLVPHIAYRPWTIQADLSGTKVFYYPVSDESLHEEEDPYRPPASLVLHYRALGDENRLRLLKLLHERDRTLQEFTEALDLAKSTIHHHLALLRSAGLVRLDGATYTLKTALLHQSDKQLTAYLERGGVSHDGKGDGDRT